MAKRKTRPLKPSQTKIEFTCCDLCAGQAVADLVANEVSAYQVGPRTLILRLPKQEAVDLLLDYGFMLTGERTTACFRVVEPAQPLGIA